MHQKFVAFFRKWKQSYLSPLLSINPIEGNSKTLFGFWNDKKIAIAYGVQQKLIQKWLGESTLIRMDGILKMTQKASLLKIAHYIIAVLSFKFALRTLHFSLCSFW